MLLFLVPTASNTALEVTPITRIRRHLEEGIKMNANETPFVERVT